MKALLFLLIALLPSGLDLVRVEGGVYTVGRPGHPRNPRRRVKLAPFEIGVTEVTNAQFAQFIKATGYRTDAEKNGFGMTFEEGMEDWEWASTRGADWQHPFGPDRPGIEGKDNHPVTQISFNDARAFCRWVGCRLPTAEEWEVAARGDSSDTAWPWGDVYAPNGKQMANTWQGETHHKNLMTDGFLYTAPVKQFPPNSRGLYDVIGNVFEYCLDERARRSDGTYWAAGRGGSWWCSPSTCDYFNLADIGRMDPRGTLPNQGFRVARDLVQP